ncbi:sensor domain-containing diguanylate cyclase [Methylophilus aquaticus]|uniref:diguanylate cyclase n=1 Tax=Methylophilus aquaticus TaxID=1971610 RepID=A0ABT9JW16_9PROT|nr:sensor domain-containing diguanylate cyclase [Methylophilus aquaticus]MDP8568782.1 diguanylate cyclase [Methylophilus aquaticus]
MVVNKRLYTLLLSIIVLAGFLATSLIGYFVAKDSLTDRLQQEMLPLTSDNIYSEIQRDLLQPLLISSLMANDVFVFDWVNNGEQDASKMTSYLAQIQKKYHTITAFFVSESTGQYYHPTGVLKKVSASNPEDGWYFQARAARQPYVINIDRDTADQHRLSIFVNYRIEDKSGNFIGVIGVGLSLQTVVELIENYQKRYGREIYFVNREGDVMLQSSHYNPELHIQNKAGLDKAFVQILTSPSASFSFKTSNGSVLYLNSRLVPEFDWYLIVEQVNDPSSERLETAFLINMGVALVISAIVLLLAHVAVRGYHDKLETMATQDKLTGAASRQVFEFYFKQAVARCKRRDEPLALVLLDIDLFKMINDNYGHQAGDRVLNRVAQLIKSHVREEDVVCRWGGEEFLVMLSGCDLAHARDITEVIRSAVAALQFPVNNAVAKITLSAGIAQMQEEETLGQIVERADHHLYQAKNAGRNCIKPDPAATE